MPEAWFNFVVVFLVQLALFVIHAWYEKRFSDALRILRRGALSGVVLGPILDLTFGKFLGLCSYTLGFGTPFLLLNGVLLYGLFAANVLLMQRARLLHFCIWSMVVAAVFEITNLFFHLWTYAFAVPSIEFFLVVLIGNVGSAILVAMVWHVFLGYKFSFIDRR